MVERCAKWKHETPEPICYIISGDLAHIGPKFGDCDGGASRLSWRSSRHGRRSDPDRGGRRWRFRTILERHHRGTGSAAHLRLATHLHGAGCLEAGRGQAVALRSVRSSARLSKASALRAWRFTGEVASVADADIRIHIIGVGSDGLAVPDQPPGACCKRPTLCWGRIRPWGPYRSCKQSAYAWVPTLAKYCDCSKANMGRRLVLVATGDPLFYGVSQPICATSSDAIASKSCPHVSSMQLAFARVKETWEEAYLTNLATHPLASVIDRIRTPRKQWGCSRARVNRRQCIARSCSIAGS